MKKMKNAKNLKNNVVVANGDNQNIKGDDHMTKKNIQTKELLKKNGYLFTVQDILANLSVADGFKSRNSKNFARVIGAMAKGVHILDILKDPMAIGVPKNQLRYFKKFVEEHKIANRVYTPTRKGVLVPVADIERMELRGDKVYSTIDYSEVNIESHKEISESYLSETFAGKEELIEFTMNGKLIKKRVMLPMRNIFFVNLNLDLPENEEDYTKEHVEAIGLRKKVMKEGFYFMDENGNENHAYFLMRTASQARILQAIFIDTSFMKPTEALKALGNELIAYAKIKDNKYVVDVDKMITRPGLAGTNSVASKTIDIGNEIVEKGNEQWIMGGTHVMVVAEDRKVKIATGKYRAWDADKQEFREFDAKEHPITLTAADGAIFCDEEIYHTLAAEFGQYNDAWQIRITPFTKGLMVFVPGLRNYYNAHIVALKSAVKGDYKNLFEANPNFKPQFRVAIFNKRPKQVKRYTDMPYQFIQASSMNVKDLWTVLEPHLKEVSNAFHDPDIIKSYLGLDKVIDPELFDEETEHYLLDQSRVSTITTFLDMFPWVYEDAQMKRYALDILKEKIKDWKTGNIPVEGHYRYMIQDPYAVLQAGTKYEERNEKGELLIKNRGHDHIQPGEGYFPSVFKEKSNVYVAAGRNPMITKGEWQVLRNRPLAHYRKATRKGAFRNIAVYSVHDMATFAQGGADNDGDTSLIVTDENIVAALKRKPVSPVMDISFRENEDGSIEWLGDGVPYSMELSGVYRLPEGMVEEQDNYRIVFTKDQNTDELYEEVHKLGIDYVIRTLNPNKIGFATNIATILADAVRGLGYAMLHGKVNKEFALNRIKTYENWIDILRLVQGWEIDAAKHGGAYQEVMAETLDFMENPPKELSYYNKNLGKRVWNKPNWLAARQDRKGHDLGSVLSQIRNMVQHFEDKVLTEQFEKMYENANEHSILAKLNSVFDLDPAYFTELEKQVKVIKSSYGRAIRHAHHTAESEKKKLISMNLDEDLRYIKMEKIEEKLDAYINDIADWARDQITDLMNKYPAKDIGYVAYYITYVDRKKDASLAFPWTIARESFIQTLSYVENREKQVQIKSGEIADTNITLAVCIPDDIQEKFGMDTVLKGLAKANVFIQAKGDKYNLIINKTEIGFVYNSKNNIAPLLGHDKYKLNISTLNRGNGKRTVNLEVAELIKVGE